MDPRTNTTQCDLCGSTLRPDGASQATDADGELLTTVAEHRCAPRVQAFAARGLGIGTPVDVRERFRRKWSTGFEVVDANASGYVLRRMSDSAVLPDQLHDGRRSSLGLIRHGRRNARVPNEPT